MSDRFPAWQLGYSTGRAGEEYALPPYPRTTDNAELIRWWRDGHFVGVHDYRTEQRKNPMEEVVKHPCPQCGLLFTPGTALASHIRSHEKAPEPVEIPTPPASNDTAPVEPEEATGHVPVSAAART